MYPATEEVIQTTRNWVQSVVIQLNLCPFAHQVYARKQVRFKVSEATSVATLLAHLEQELERLQQDDAIETTLLIHPRVLTNFYDYNDVLDLADQLLVDLHLEGIFQIASFHPDYQFSGTQPEDVENYTNKSPYPMLHLLREDRVAAAIDNFPGTEKIPEANVARLRQLGPKKMQALLQACFNS